MALFVRFFLQVFIFSIVIYITFSSSIFSPIFFSVAFAERDSGISFKGSNRISIVGTSNRFDEFKATNITPFDKGNGITTTLELGMPFSLGTNFNYFENRDVYVNWKGNPNTRIEFYGYMVDLFAKFTLPIGFFQPWIGAGYGWGVLTFSNPSDREVDNMMIGVYSRGSRSAFGPFGFGGLDLAFGTSGLRFWYSLRKPTTDTSEVLGAQPYDMRIETVGLGIWVNQ